MEEVLRLYSLPAREGVVRLCMDEQPCQLLSEVMTPIPAKPESVKKVDYEYKREGTCVVFLAYDIDLGKRYTQVSEQRTKKDYAAFIDKVIAENYVDARQVKLVQDNLNTHTKGAFYEHLPRERAGALSALIDFVYTPKHGSWLNMAETEFSALSRQCLDRRIGSVDALQAEVGPWTARRNEDGVKISWSFTVANARTKLVNRYNEVNAEN
jgi:transposase